ETAHHLAIASLSFASGVPLLLDQLRRFAPVPNPTNLFGLTFPNPVGLAAGFDKNGVALPAWEALGFGFIEIGTVTARPQPGNPKPRIFRYPEQQALINRLGFNNDGADVVAERLRKLAESGSWPRVPIGINIGKSKVTELANAADDYLYSFTRLREFADYVVLNVSSPNTPGLRDLQQEEALATLLAAIQSANADSRKPIILKIAPDLTLDGLDRVIATCEQNAIAGIIATNTTLDHSAVLPPRDEVGGLSGAPLREKATAFIRTIADRTRLPLIGVGGIADAPGAREKFEAGADLIQVYTGYIYKGPGLLRELAGA
ncbi:MAG TPA: quinone-dependent dihydroorotate dehydrogenase, partial [Chthoniobacterales bacterium]|nr:quinone-dependent dihydroorotate dehydrogenase [Chthoniobacterales bacterium]